MNRAGRVFGGLLSLAVLAAILVAVLNFRSVDDWLKLRNYNPPIDIANVAAEDVLTSQARHIFYVNHPQLISDISTFRSDCTFTEQTIVLGCYHSDQEGIFIYNVHDPRLNGVIEVTAAHEMLHGAYDRLSQSDKDRINSLLENYYQNDLHDQRIIDTINSYKKVEPNDVVNEMHSVFGTEIANLPAPLETYYQRYFTNRSIVTTFAAGYQAEFTSRLNRINNLEAQLKALKQQINNEESNLSTQQAAIEADRQRLDNLRASGQVAQYNAAVGTFNNEIDTYNDGIAKLRVNITDYNNLVAQHNELAAELRSLYSSLDTSLTSQAAQ